MKKSVLLVLACVLTFACSLPLKAMAAKDFEPSLIPYGIYLKLPDAWTITEKPELHTQNSENSAGSHFFLAAFTPQNSYLTILTMDNEMENDKLRTPLLYLTSKQLEELQFIFAKPLIDSFNNDGVETIHHSDLSVTQIGQKNALFFDFLCRFQGQDIKQLVFIVPDGKRLILVIFIYLANDEQRHLQEIQRVKDNFFIGHPPATPQSSAIPKQAAAKPPTGSTSTASPLPMQKNINSGSALSAPVVELISYLGSAVVAGFIVLFLLWRVKLNNYIVPKASMTLIAATGVASIAQAWLQGAATMDLRSLMHTWSLLLGSFAGYYFGRKMSVERLKCLKELQATLLESTEPSTLFAVKNLALRTKRKWALLFLRIYFVMLCLSLFLWMPIAPYLYSTGDMPVILLLMGIFCLMLFILRGMWKLRFWPYPSLLVFNIASNIPDFLINPQTVTSTSTIVGIAWAALATFASWRIHSFTRKQGTQNNHNSHG